MKLDLEDERSNPNEYSKCCRADVVWYKCWSSDGNSYYENNRCACCGREADVVKKPDGWWWDPKWTTKEK